MIADLKPYAQYKESELPWLGPVPRQWSVKRIKTVLREIDCRSTDGKGTLLSLTRVRGLIPHNDMTDKMHSAKTLVGYKRYRAGQLVMNRMQAWSGMFGAGEIDGLISPDYAVFDVLGGHAIKHVLERLKTPDLVAQFALESKGIGSGFNRLYTDRFGSIRISLPPLDEQPAIIRFLDWANGRLERAIRSKRRVIALLDEQKNATIHRAVTRGLDPNVPLKPSGIPWLGEIPHHWGVMPLKFLCTRIQNGATPSTSQQHYYQDGTVPWFGPSSISTSSELRTPVRYLARAAFDDGQARLIIGPAILVVVIGATAGKMSLLLTEGATNQQITAFELRQGRIVPQFGIQQLRASEDWLKSTASTATIPILDSGIVNRLALALPPVGEQERILSALSNQTRPLSTTISRVEREIGLLREYRTRLVADVVTGKLDVLETAARLPEESLSDTAEEPTDSKDETESVDEEAGV